jgi:3',5'-cyclic AMP phosphodiesterase CpdA
MPAMRIVVISDTHLALRAASLLENWRVVARWIAEAHPDLVVHLGDISLDGASNPAELREAASLLADLGVPIRFLPGNHDIGDNPIAPDAPTEHLLDLARLEEYRAIFGPDRWSLRAGAWRMIGLNAQLFGTATAEEEQQFDWLASELRGGGGPLGLMLHKPLFRDGPEDDEPHVRYVPEVPRRRLLAMLDCHELRFVLSGHAHQSRTLLRDDVEHRWAPSAAFCLPDAMQERIGDKEVGILTLRLRRDNHCLAMTRPEGLLRHNILNHPQLYPGISALRARLGAAAAHEPASQRASIG